MPSEISILYIKDIINKIDNYYYKCYYLEESQLFLITDSI